jgi:hypothetical protein
MTGPRTSEEFVNKEINKIGIKKATGKDGISSKILKLSKIFNHLSSSSSSLFTRTHIQV